MQGVIDGGVGVMEGEWGGELWLGGGDRCDMEQIACAVKSNLLQSTQATPLRTKP